MDSNVTMNTNPCYDINNQNRKEETEYDYVESNKIFNTYLKMIEKNETITKKFKKLKQNFMSATAQPTMDAVK